MRIIIALTIIAIASCKQQELLNRDAVWFNDSSILSSQDREDFMFPSRIYLRTTFQNNSHGVAWFNTDGSFVLLRNSNGFGVSKSGFAIDFYYKRNRTRLRSIKYVDSNSRVTGPVFIYNKRGRLKHILRYKSNCFDTVLYSRNPREVFEDTFGIDIQTIKR
jgi:hypothetical protein